jgi:hypothetical protein
MRNLTTGRIQLNAEGTKATHGQQDMSRTSPEPVTYETFCPFESRSAEVRANVIMTRARMETRR